MKSGMEMMLESMGIQTGAIKQLLDPENVKKLLTKIETMCNDIDAIKERLCLNDVESVIVQIQRSIERVEIKLGTLPESVAMQLLQDGASDAFKDAAEFVRSFNNGNSGDSDNGNGSDTGSINGDANGIGNGRGI